VTTSHGGFSPKHGRVSPEQNNARQTLGAFFKYCRSGVGCPGSRRDFARAQVQGEAGRHRNFHTARNGVFLNYSRPELVPFLALGAFAGLRSAEIGRLDWEEVHLADRIIEIKATKAKTASRRIVPVTENLAKWLAPYAKEEGRVVPFDNVSKQIGWLVEDTNEGLKKAAEKGKQDVGKLKPLKWKRTAFAQLHQLPCGRHTEREPDCARMWQLTGDHLQTLPRIGSLRGGKEVVRNSARRHG
jgi:hypothetical protein